MIREGARGVRLAVLMVTGLAGLVVSCRAEAGTTPRPIIVATFDASSLAPDDRWLGDGIAHLVSLGLAEHPAFIQVERGRLATVVVPGTWSEDLVGRTARDRHAEAAFSGRISRNSAEIVLQPFMADVRGGTVTWLSPLTLPPADFLTRAASVAPVFARALHVTVEKDDQARMERAAQPTRSPAALELLTRGRLAFHDGALPTAVDLLVRAIEKDPTCALAQYVLGTVHHALGARWKAAAQYRAASHLDSTMPEPFKATGDLLLQAPRSLSDQAIEAYARAISLRASYAAAHVGLGDARAAKGDIDGALAAYRAALTFDPFDPRTHHQLGRIYANQGRCDDAADAYKRASQLDPGLAHGAAPCVGAGR